MICPIRIGEQFTYFRPRYFVEHFVRKWSAVVIALLCVSTPSVTAQEQNPQTLQRITAAIPRDFPPQSFLNKSGQPVGFAVDVMNAIASRANLQVNYLVESTWMEVQEALRSGRADVIPNLGITDARDEAFDFTASIETFSGVIFTRSSTFDIRGIEDLHAKQVAVVQTNIAAEVLRPHQDIHLVVFDDVRKALFELLAGQVDALVYPEPVVWKIASQAGVSNQIQTVGTPLWEVRRALAVRQGNEVLLSQLNAAVTRFVNTEDYQRIYRKWYGTPPTFWTPAKFLWIICGVSLLIFLVMALWRYRSLVTHNKRLTHEITQREHVESELRKSEDRFAKAYNTSPAGMAITRIKDGLFIDANEAFLEIFGFRRDEVIGHTSSEVNMLRPEEREKLIQAQLDSGGLRNCELQAQAKSGKKITILFSSNPIEIDDEACHITTLIDITQHKDAEASLAESEERLRLATELANVAVWEYNFTLNNMSRSRNHDRLYGLDWQDTWNLDTFVNATHPDDRAISLNTIQEAITPGGDDTYAFDFRVRYPDQSIHWLSVVGQVLERDQQGQGILVRGSLIDITDRKQAENELRKSEEKYRNFIENTHEGVWAIDANANTVFVNSRMAEILGYAEDEMLGKHLFSFMDEQGVTIAQHNLARRKQGIKEQHDFEFLHKKGNRVHVSLSTNPYFDSNGNYAGATAFVSDITERKQIENNLIESEKRYRSLFENMTAGFVLFQVVQNEKGDPIDLLILAANNGFEVTTGLEAQEVIGKRLTHVLPGIEHDDADWIGIYGKIALTGTSQQFEQYSEHLGYHYYVSAYQSEPNQCAVTFLDITNRKRAEQELKESEERFKRALENIPDVVVIYDTNLRVQYINTATNHVTGRPTTDFVGKQEEEIWPPEVYQVYLPTLHEALDAGAIRILETNIVLPGAGTRNLKITCIPLFDDRGHVREMMGITHDLTARKQAEDAIREHRKQLQTLSRRLVYSQEEERRHIARELHDEIGQALSSIKVNIRMAQRQTDVANQELMLKESVDIIERTLQQVRNMSLNLRPSLLDDLGLVPALRWYLDRQAQRVGFLGDLETNREDVRLDSTIEITCFRIVQEALTNIMRHANAKHVSISLKETHDELHLAICDDGNGFDVAEAFKQATEGSSMGLLSLRERAELAGGRLEIDSTPGQGTKIRAFFSNHSSQVEKEQE